MKIGAKCPIIDNVRVNNYKAICDSKKVSLSPLTVLVGDNGSGKNSLIDALETYSSIVATGLGEGLERQGIFEDILNKKSRREPKLKLLFVDGSEETYLDSPLQFSLEFKAGKERIKTNLAISMSPAGDRIAIVGEQILTSTGHYYRFPGIYSDNANALQTHPFDFHPSRTIVSRCDDLSVERLRSYIEDWQFLALNASEMKLSQPIDRTRRRISLKRDGSNIADYLRYIQNSNPEFYNDLVDAMKWVLPYLKDLQPALTATHLHVYLTMKESDFQIPSQILSTGTLRLIALVALLRHPNPPPLIVIDEIENGIDPRTIHFILNHIRNAVEDGRTQVIVTTHSSFFLDLLPLSDIVVVERDKHDRPIFWRPGSSKEIRSWAKQFASGDLYTMGRMHKYPAGP